MRIPFAIIFSAVLLLVPAAWAQDDEVTPKGGERNTVGSVEIGGWDADPDGSPDVVSEYEPDDGGPTLRLSLDSYQDWGSLFLSMHARDGDDQNHALDFDVKRSIRSHTSYVGMLHRLGHDPMTNLEAATNHGRVVYNTDLDPTDIYGTDVSWLEHRTEIQPRSSPGFTFGIDYRRQDREGVQQSLTISHCDACHVYSQSRPIDEKTEDAAVDLAYAWEGGTRVKASFRTRELSEGVPSISLLFDNALHPELRKPVFDNRLQFDSAQGPVAVDLRPDITKDVSKLAFVFPDVAGFVVNVDGVISTTENEYTGLQSDYEGVMVHAARAFKKPWRVRWRARFYSIDNDSVFVDTNEPLGVAGPQAGRTYRQIYGFDPDFLRLSALDRDVIESRLEASYKLGKKTGTLKFAWDFESTDREYYQVAPGETETTENVFGVSWWARPRKGARVNASLRHGEIDNPFMTVNGGYSTLVSTPVPNPFHPSSAQYYEVHGARIADTTAGPDSWDELKLGYNRTLAKTAFSVSYRYWDGDNSSGDLTDWSRNVQGATVSLWSGPSEQVSWNLSYARNDSEVEFPSFVPIFDG